MTPSKRLLSTHDIREPLSTQRRQDRSPLSVSKPSSLNAFLTPSARRIVDKSTPISRSGVSKLRFDETPAFLRRDFQRAYCAEENKRSEEGIAWSPIAIRKLPSAAGRGLSALVKGLRDMEDERLDEEMNILRKIEGDRDPNGQRAQSRVLVEDSQALDMPLGPDRGGGSEGSDDQENERTSGDCKSLKVWKKKGQKRTTRRVIMKPNTAKWMPEPEWKGDKARLNKEDEDEGALIDEAQISSRPLDGNENGCEQDELCTEAKVEAHCARKSRENMKGFATKIKKKISATAHANFRVLKIKNKQSKGKRGGKFRRRS